MRFFVLSYHSVLFSLKFQSDLGVSTFRPNKRWISVALLVSFTIATGAEPKEKKKKTAIATLAVGGLLPVP